jgi:two-component system cell cycle sensor histidine kinase/response regulator CckA
VDSQTFTDKIAVVTVTADWQVVSYNRAFHFWFRNIKVDQTFPDKRSLYDALDIQPLTDKSASNYLPESFTAMQTQSSKQFFLVHEQNLEQDVLSTVFRFFPIAHTHDKEPPGNVAESLSNIPAATVRFRFNDAAGLRQTFARLNSTADSGKQTQAKRDWYKKLFHTAAIEAVNDLALRLLGAKNNMDFSTKLSEKSQYILLGSLRRAIEALFASSPYHTGFFVLEDPNGEKTYISYAQIINKQIDNSIITTFLFNDITADVRIKKDQTRDLNKYRNFFEKTSIGVYQTTPDGHIKLANPALVALLKFNSFAEMQGWETRKISYVNPSDELYFNQQMQSKGFVLGFETSWRCKNGEVIHIRESARAIKGIRDNILFYEGTVEDISAKHRIERQLRQSQKMDAIGRMAQGFAHDFNNILTIIRGRAELAMSAIEEKSAIYQDIIAITNASEKAARLTGLLQGFYRGHAEEPGQISINEVLQNLSRMVDRILSKEIDFRIEAGDDLPNIFIEAGQIEQIVMNLIINARDAVLVDDKKPVKSIQLTTGVAKPDKTRFIFKERIAAKSYVYLAVSDNGIGIDPDALSRIFDPFYSTKGKNAGLGLSIVYNILKNCMGNVAVNSSDKGSTFTLYFPVITDSVKKSADLPKKYLITKNTDAATILFVEDETELRELATAFLAKGGYKVESASTGLKAIQKLQDMDFKVDVIVTDIVMPEMNGWDMAATIHKINQNIRFVFTSGYSDKLQKKPDMPPESYLILPKPYSPQNLIGKIEELA